MQSDPFGKPLGLSLITNALFIQGWMSVSELSWLAEQARLHATIVELGSFYGRSTRALADNTNGVVYALDNWQSVEGLDGADKDLDMGQVRSKFFENLKAHVQSGKVVPVDVDHRSPYKLLIKPDLVFIDGGHRYEEVSDDIQKWVSKIQKGGLICGHDIPWPGVKQAVEEWFPDYQVAPNTSIWFKILDTEAPSVSES